MRTSIGIGLLATVFLFACASTGDTATTNTDPNAPAGSGEGTTTDPNATKDPTDPDAAPAPLVPNLAVTDIAIFQAVRVPVVTKGAWVKTRNAPVVANRPALARIYVAPSSGFKAREVTAEVRLVDGATKFPILRETKKISAASTEDDTDSTFNLEIPADHLPPGVTIQVALTAEDGEVPTGDSDARFPRDGAPKAVDAELSGKLRIKLVPVKYDADGSGRVPDLSATQLELYKKRFMTLYPATEVEITTRAPFSWTTAISRNGSGFSSVLNAITRLRQQDKPDADVYYYGALAPAPSMSQFCSGGCVSGLSTVVGENTSFLRASVGLAYPGEDSVNTAAHEVGHAHGRNHAPCGGADGVDPEFPYSNGAIGVWGYDIFEKTLISPTRGRDMMGYCPNEWVSDYTYNALFERIATVNSQANFTAGSAGGAPSAQQTFRVANVDASGNLAWDGDLDLDQAPTGGTTRAIDYVAADASFGGTRTIAKAVGHFYPYDHLPGGIVLVPKNADVARWTHVRVSGAANTLAR